MAYLLKYALKSFANANETNRNITGIKLPENRLKVPFKVFLVKCFQKPSHNYVAMGGWERREQPGFSQWHHPDPGAPRRAAERRTAFLTEFQGSHEVQEGWAGILELLRKKPIPQEVRFIQKKKNPVWVGFLSFWFIFSSFFTRLIQWKDCHKTVVFTAVKISESPWSL